MGIASIGLKPANFALKRDSITRNIGCIYVTLRLRYGSGAQKGYEINGSKLRVLWPINNQFYLDFVNRYRPAGNNGRVGFGKIGYGWYS